MKGMAIISTAAIEKQSQPTEITCVREWKPLDNEKVDDQQFLHNPFSLYDIQYISL